MGTEALLEALAKATISPYEEALAYEYLYSRDGMTLTKLAELTVNVGKLPTAALAEYSGLLDPEGYEQVKCFFDAKLNRLSFGIAVKGTPSWPSGLADSRRPAPVLYFCGDIKLLETPRVSVVGSRKASQAGLARASRLGHELAEADVTVVSGLARGVDSSAMRSAVNTTDGYRVGRTIGVIGTPVDECYPRENARLQSYVANHDLLVSQVPFFRYSIQPFSTKRYYFPERNELMAALSDATVIVEASDTSGTLAQARACLHQGRPLFILRSCLENKSIEWPRKWVERDGVYVLDSTSDVIEAVKG